MSACDRVVELAAQIELAEGMKAQGLWREYVNAWLECNGHPEDATRNSKDIRDLATTIVGRLDNPFITVEDTDVQLGAIIAGRENSCADPSKSAVHRGADPVMSFNGQFVYETQDLSISGAGIDFVFTRSYKNQGRFRGPLGFNWNHSYNHSLRVAGDTIFRSTGDLRVDAHIRHPRFGQSGFNYWMPPDGQDGVIIEHGNSFIWRAPHGVRHVFRQDPNPFLHRLDRIEDRHGNYLQLSYAEDRLRLVSINHPQRFVIFEHDEQDRIVAMRDFTGREWSYCYDFFGDLVSVTGPPTDQYPNGLTVCYEYSSAQFGGELAHNLCRIIDPAGRVYLENEYGTEPGLLRFNRVIRQRQGGGEFSFEYDDVPPESEFDYTEEERPAHQTVRVERNGQPVCQVFNRFGQLLSETQRILEDGVLRTLTWRYRFNRDGALIGSLSPEGVMTQKLFGREYFALRHGVDSNGNVLPDALTRAERQRFGQLLATVKRARRYDWSEFSLARGVWGDFFPDIISAFDPSDAVAKFTYEPTYGQVLTVSDPRFTRTPDPAVQTAALGEDPRYEGTLTRYVYTGPAANPGSDPTRLLSEIQRPTPTLPDGTPGGPVADRLTEYDERGRLLRAFGASGVETVHAYFGAADGVREGHRKQTIVDPGGLAVTTRYDVDDLGRVVAVHSPRSVGAPPGQFVTRTEYNALDQVVSTTQSEPFAFTTRHFYDRSGKLIREERDARNDSGADLPGAPAVQTWIYDDELNLIEETSGGHDAATRLVKRHRYDRAGRKFLTILPEGNRIRYHYDERQLLVAQTIGDGTELAATTRTRYDGDGRARTVIDARGNESTFTCDPYGRVIATEDRLGNIIRRDYDKLDQATVTRVFEKRPDGYYLLARNEANYDELGRDVRHAVNRFDQPPGPVPKHELATAFLTTPIPGGDVLNGTVFYDAHDRPLRTVDALQREMRYEYDALGRVRMAIDHLGNQIVNRYDAHSNVVRCDLVDLVRDPDDPTTVIGQRVFSSTATYDELDRVSTSTDSLGNVTAFAYDSRNLLVCKIDSLGNLSRIAYDIHGRRVYQRSELTATGLGGSPVQQVVEERYEYDRNGNLVRATDALGRPMEYGYDALDRRRTVVYPDGSRCSFTFDADGHLIHRRDNNGLQHRYAIDPLGRTIRIDVDTSAVTGGETGGATFERYTYDALNRRIRDENDFARCDTRFNSLDWVLSETMTCTVPGAPLSGPLVIEREFNDVGALVGLRYPNGRELRLERDELNRLTRLQNVVTGADYPGDAAAPEAYEIARFDYAGHQQSRRRHGNGTTSTYAHDGAGRLIELDHANSAGSLLRLQYLFDSASNLRIRNEITAVSLRGDVFAYDSMRRLVHERAASLPVFDPALLAPAAVVPPDPLPRRQAAIDTLIGPLEVPPAPHTYEYDLVGNRRVERRGAAVNYTTNELDQYTQVADTGTGQSLGFLYDLNGNLRDDGARAYVYDAMNRLVRVSEAGVTIAEFFHDTRGRRVMERTVDGTTQIVWDGLNQISEYRDGTLFAQYVHSDGGDHLVQIAARLGSPGTNGAEHWYHADLVGSVRLLTTRAGMPAASYGYEPFGQMRDTLADAPYNPFLYTGQRLDKGLGTYDFHFRQYAPDLGRFLQRDPAGSTDSSNLYTYAVNAPLALVDPLGTEARPEIDRAAALDATLKPYWERLDELEAKNIYSQTASVAEENVPRNKARVQKVFRAYRAILKEIRDASLAGRDIDIKELWNENRITDWQETSWMDLCSSAEKCAVTLSKIGPFHGETVMGLDIAQTFRILTKDEQPNPSLPQRIIVGATEAILVFGPDVAVGMEIAAMRRGALAQGAARSTVSIRPLSYEEYLKTTPGSSIAMGTYGGFNEVYLENEARKLGYRTLGTPPRDAARLGIKPPVPDSVRNKGSEAIVEHEVNAYLKPADRIGFWLTGEEYKYPTSITTMELQRVMDDPALFKKTQFYMNPFGVRTVPHWKPTPGVVTTIPPEKIPVKTIAK